VLAAALAAPALGSIVWGSVEARRLVRETAEVPLVDLPSELDGLTLLHVSDVHAGYGPGLAMLEAALDWALELRPDLVVISGDLVARPRGEARFRQAAEELGRTARFGAFAVLGNHDYGVGNDPFASGRAVGQLEGVELLGAERRELEIRGRRVCIVGVDADAYLHSPRYDVARPLDRTADLRILICHYPFALQHVQPGDFQLILAGHLHGGQICLPWPGGRVGLAHPRERVLRGVSSREGTVMHVSRGLGTTFLPLRILARPEASLLVLRSPR
jgi:predicted MPP superfamily phosphohydrolase